MPSFVAPCPRGHRGNFITLPTNDYHVCFCGLHIPVFSPPQDTLSEEEQDKLNEQYIQEGIAKRVEDEIRAKWREIDEESDHLLSRYQERLQEIDPEWNTNKQGEYLDNLRA